MANLKTIFKSLLFIVLAAFLAAACYVLLVKFHVITPPAFMPAVPYIQESTGSEKNMTELQKVKRENDKLKRKLVAQESEIELLKNDIKTIETKHLAAQKADEEYKNEISELNEQLHDSRQSKTDQEGAYKDIAKYFASMKTKDGAELLARLDENDAIGILEHIDTDTAAEILQKMPKEKALALTRKMLVTTP
ncbi:Magnesium transporter, MgtE intracellular domain [Syntrophomonas zehnderi OL-4]|uniref:Magnesium transporter, MgtE intracellular domain n=1 Tax=Syntrophomonas zehnderi OL-4 TaxID=690567 RepID=A0A0E4C8S3_9FIRM|nr:hypothetical protein [Syntrophomonas zehnderi]CFX65029.1 Magnesium transporter, MgtE intracellular domain [Syntrophomonas zehnderi OL-4]